MADGSLENDAVWGLVVRALSGNDPRATVLAESWSVAELADLLFKLLVGNVTELARRYKQFGATGEKELPWSIFDMLLAPRGEVSESRVKQVRSIRAQAQASKIADGFSNKYIGFFKDELDACVESGGRFGGIAFDVLEFVNDEAVIDVQHIESKNSVLGVMTARGRTTKKDLLSSRHVIKASDKNLVTPAMYTSTFMKRASKAAKHFSKRFVDVPHLGRAPGQQVRCTRPI